MKATLELVNMYRRLFVNRLAYTRQSHDADPETGCYYYYLSKKAYISLKPATIRAHLEGKITIGLYAINPRTQRCKWLAFDADYEGALKDLRRLQSALLAEGVQSGLEMSRRGGHLWVFSEKPLLARELQIFAYNFVLSLGMAIKRPRKREGQTAGNTGEVEGIEIFPKQDKVDEGKFGNAMRGPLGVHRAAKRRFWFADAGENLLSQITYLDGLHKLDEVALRSMIAGKTMPGEYATKTTVSVEFKNFAWPGNVFRIRDHIVGRVRRIGTEYVTQCPSCHNGGRDRHRDNLHISVANELKYCCRAGCSADMIREALGFPRRHIA
jgi:hypothetical protein